MDPKPLRPLKGRGYSRIEVSEEVYNVIKSIYPLHCEIIGVRRPINRFGKLGLRPSFCVSPEIWRYFNKNEFPTIPGDNSRVTFDLLPVKINKNDLIKIM